MPLTQFESSIYPTLVRNASDLLEAKPWMSLESTDVFAVQNPDSEEMVFVQVSGGVDQEPVDVTDQVTWNINPTEFTLTSQTSVTVTASLERARPCQSEGD